MENVVRVVLFVFYLAFRSLHLMSLIMGRFDCPGGGLNPNLKIYFVL